MAESVLGIENPQVMELNFEVVAWNDHTKIFAVSGKHKHSSRKKNIRNDTIWVPLRDHGLNTSASSRARPETVGLLLQ